jgi:hypothetical protein
MLKYNTWLAILNPNSLAMGTMATLKTIRSMLHNASAHASGTVVLKKLCPAQHGFQV